MSTLSLELLRRSDGCDAVVFDIGNTLLEWSKQRIAETYFPEEVRAILFHAMFVKDHRWHWMCFDVGDRPQEEVARLIAEEAGCPEQAGAILNSVRHFRETLRPMPLTLCLPELKASGKRLFALSNYAQPQADEAWEMFPFFRLFEGKLISADIHICKPDERIYRLLCEKYHLIPSRTLFVDDLKDNTDAAETLGFRVWHDFASYYD